jgi:thioredoxin 1
MDMNSIMSVVTVIVLGLIFFWRWSISSKTAAMVGKPAPDTSAVDNRVPTASRVYYFYGEHCRACKTIAPMVDELSEDFPNLIQVDVATHIDLATKFGVLGTPTFVAVGDGLIRDVKLGSASKVWLTAYLEHQ